VTVQALYDNIPGHKSDMNDTTWLAGFMAHGLVRGSFVPPEPLREPRDQTRTRAVSGAKCGGISSGRITNLLGRTGQTVLDATHYDALIKRSGNGGCQPPIGCAPVEPWVPQWPRPCPW
jgi:hypothetical protein